MKFLLMLLGLCACFQQKNRRPKNFSTLPQKEKIRFIQVSTFGGEMGCTMTLTIKIDSLFYHSFCAASAPENEKKISKAFNTFLEKMLSQSELDSFAKLTNGSTYQHVDGADTRITISTNKRVLAITNNNANALWNGIHQKCMTLLERAFKQQH